MIVEITGFSNRPGRWYADKIGQHFEVREAVPEDGPAYEQNDYMVLTLVNHGIDRADCKIVSLTQ